MTKVIFNHFKKSLPNMQLNLFCEWQFQDYKTEIVCSLVEILLSFESIFPSIYFTILLLKYYQLLLSNWDVILVVNSSIFYPLYFANLKISILARYLSRMERKMEQIISFNGKFMLTN